MVLALSSTSGPACQELRPSWRQCGSDGESGDQDSGLTGQRGLGQAQSSWAPSPTHFGKEIDQGSLKARPGPRLHITACQGWRGRCRRTSI